MERSRNIIFIVILLSGCFNFLFAQPKELPIKIGRYDNNISELNGDVMIITSKTYKQKSEHYNKKDFPKINHLPVNQEETKKIFDENGNVIYVERKRQKLHLYLDLKASSHSDQQFYYYETNYEPPLDSLSILNTYDENNNLVQSIKRSVYRRYLDEFNFKREKYLDSIKVSHEKADLVYNDENKKIQAKIYESDRLKYESTYEYDDEGMNIGQVYIRYDSLGNIEVKKSYSHKYDKHGNLSELECYDIEGKLTRKITPEFDENGNLKKTKKKFINEDGSLNRITINKYDIKGNNILRKECFTKSCKSAIEYKFDKSGKLIEETRYRDSEIVTKINHEEEKDEAKGKPIYKYDSQGNWVEKFYIEPLNDRQYFICTKIKRTIVYYQ